MNNSILIIGAGAAGLMAAKELSEQQFDVTILEANDRLGGRIYTLSNHEFSQPIEAGAEFIHTHSDLTKQLLREAKIHFHSASGKMIRSKNGEWKRENDFTEGWDELMRKMHQLKEDVTIAEFLQRNFSDEKYKSLRESVKGFAEGFDLADLNQASTFALRDEWSQEEDEQSRVEGGYQKLTNYLADVCAANGCVVEASTAVKEIHWKKSEVKIITEHGKNFFANKVIITVPISVLQSELNAKAAISFTPSIYEFFQASKMIGYGTVTKILLQFNEHFWKNDVGFILSDEKIPVWWTQLPDEFLLLTGWLNGAQAKSLQNVDAANILEESFRSLSSIFKMNITSLQQKLTASKIVDWSADPFALGGYSYNKLESANAKMIMNTPIQQTIFFAGEALYTGIFPGTVEAALISGREAAGKIINIK